MTPWERNLIEAAKAYAAAWTEWSEDRVLETDDVDATSKRLLDSALAPQDDANTAPSSPWRPIDTAPRDGAAIIAWWPHMGQPVVGWSAQRGRNAGCWTFSYGSVRFYPVGAPTHWMPIPAPPAPLPHTGGGET